ncbi:hypothetical protein PIB30_089644 [Stylosanthes scabra]|uniref:Uncharacterized protein n=1 Tax=Stylosanthes scabra TaxID=79078 RepID=A0ABU6WW04_9FABA|nr:hypothetical protein [Stylosanthes scabra]
MAENQPENQEAAVQAAEAAQMPRELSIVYRWVTRDVLGAPPVLSQGVEVARPGDRVCYLNLDYPTVPNWLWVNEVMFTEFGVRVPFSDFQQRLLNRASVTAASECLVGDSVF